MSSTSSLDLTLYLVTDEKSEYLKAKTLVQTVEDAIIGGVTIVQYRQKHGTSASRTQRASELLEITRKHQIPLIVNDDIDTCLAVGAEGLHIGQDDMKLKEAREILGKNVIIGVTISSIEEANAAIAGGADYLGVGTVFTTPTKTDTKSIIGTRGTQAILQACKTGTAHFIPCVAIGSINRSNVQRVLHQSSPHDGNQLNGVAVVSAIMAADSPREAARELRSLIKSRSDTYYAATPPGLTPKNDLAQILDSLPAIVSKHVESKTLSHNMTNTVVQNFAANVCLAIGASPIMSLNGPEASDLAALCGGLVINMGTLTPDTMAAYEMGIQAYNTANNPIIFDPVGGGATAVRKSAIEELMASGFFDVIKGNEGEINAVIGTAAVKQHGVDAGPSSTTVEQKIELVKMLARRERCIVLMTGAIDYLSDGARTFAISNGTHWLGRVTGSGCALGSVIASYVASDRGDKLVATLAGILHYEIAAEHAARRNDVNGPGTFVPAFLDELYVLGDKVRGGDGDLITHGARVELIGV